MVNFQNAIQSISENAIVDFAKEHPLISSGIAVGTVGVLGASTVAIVRSRKKKSKKSRSKKASKGHRKRTSRYARTAGKRKDSSTRRIRMTKNGQPYVITASGKAKFIKKSSARLSRKRKGGRY